MRIRGLLALTLVVAFAGPARAVRSCGDDVDGHGKRVACACGDVLVSSRVLGPADEVTAAPCPANGLVVAASGPVTLDLGGRTIAGNGQGIGVLVVRGSLLLVGPGAVERFQVGVLAHGVQALRSAVNVRVAGNRLDGLVAQGDGFTVVGSVAEGNGRTGSRSAAPTTRSTATGRPRTAGTASSSPAWGRTSAAASATRRSPTPGWDSGCSAACIRSSARRRTGTASTA